MEEQEPPIEHVQHDIDHHAEHSGSRWISWVAVSTALLAALAAVASLLSGHHANEAMLEQLRASDHWAYYQAKGIKASVLSSKIELLSSLGKDPAAKDQEKLSGYQKEQEEIKKDAEKEEAASHGHLAKHVVLARSVTLFQISITIAAIAVLTRQKLFWLVGLAFGCVGLFFLVSGLMLKV